MVASIISAMSPMIGEASDQKNLQHAKNDMKASFSGFLAESQQTITTAINDLGDLQISDTKRSELKAHLIKERAALSTLAKASTGEQFNTSGEALGYAGLKFAEIKRPTQSLAKAHLAATSGVLYCGIKMDELKGYNSPDKEALPMVNYMDSQYKAVQQNIPDYKFSKSRKFVSAIHNFYAGILSNSKDTANKSRDNSKESAK